MEYVYYVLSILGILLACLCIFRAPGLLHPRSRQVDLAAGKRVRAIKAEQAKAGKGDKTPTLQRESMNVPTPWGWPGNQQKSTASRQSGINAREAMSASDALQRWVDQMVTSKQTTEDENYRRRKEASMRALLEDRYGRANRPASIKYEKVRPPLLRDPSAPHDQMDNFPSGKLDRVEQKLKQNAAPSGERFGSQGKPRFEEQKQLRTPWGW